MDNLSGIWKCLFLRRRVSWNTQQKTSQSKGENQQQIPSTYSVEPVTLTLGYVIWRRVLLTVHVPP